MKGFVKDGVLTLATEILTVGLEILPAALLARALGVDGRGVYALITLVYGTLLLVSKGGLDVALIHFWGKSVTNRGRILTATILSGLFFTAMVMIGFGVVYLVAGPRLFAGISGRMLLPLIIFVPLGVCGDLLTQTLLAQKQIVRMNLLRLLVTTFYSLTILFCFLAGILNLTSGLVAYALMISVNFLASVLMVRRETIFGFGELKSWIVSLTGFGLKFHSGGMLHFLMSRVNVYLLAFFVGTEAVGLLSVALITERSTMISASFGRVFLGRMAHEQRKLTAAKQSALLIRFVAAMMLLVVIGLFVLRYFIIGMLYGEEFNAAVGAFVLLLPGVWALGVTQVMNPYLYGFLGKSELFAKINSLAFVVAGVVGWLLIPDFGANGAAAALSAGYVVYFLLTLISLAHLSRQSVRELLLFKPEDVRMFIKLLNPYLNHFRYLADKSLCQIRHGKEARFVLSFDLDLEGDYKAMPWLLKTLSKYEIKSSFACIGKFVERYPKIHKRMLKEGHEIVNHSYTHPDHHEFFPNIKFDQITRRQRELEIIKADKIFKKVLGYAPIGFRAPHFVYTDDLHVLLKKHGYRYSSSLLAYRCGAYGKMIKGNDLIEWPLSADEARPWKIVDTYSVFRADNRDMGNDRDIRLKERFELLLKNTLKNRCFGTVFFDPIDVKQMSNFEHLLKLMVRYRKKGLMIKKYEELV